MDLKQNLFTTCKFLILEPKKFWEKLKVNIRTPDQSYLVTDPARKILIPLIIIAGIAAFVGETMNKEFLWSYAVIRATRDIICYFLQFYISVVAIYSLLKKYDKSYEQRTVAVILAYSMIPSLLVSIIIRLFPGMYVLSIVSLYGLYLYVTGTWVMFDIIKENRLKYITLSLLILLLIFSLTGVFTWKISEFIFTNYVS